MAPPGGPNGGPNGPNGILAVAALHKNGPVQPARGPRAAQPRLKLICRRLPPGLTRAEFESALGDQWRVGGAKVDWLSYRKGSVSTDAAKPSKPARAYLHVTKHDHVKLLGDHIRSATFHDAAKSWQDPALAGPPALEYAPYPKMPGGRKRNDNRQGTIDQDHEFKDFLQSLTNPITKPAAPETEPPKDKVKTTPLIEALREKKANRDKPSTKAGRQARGEAKDEAADRPDKKILAKPGKENALNAGDRNRRITKADKAQAAKDAVKILNKEASSSKAAAATASTEKTTPAGPAPERKRANVALAKSMLQRDLGIGPAPNRRRGTKREVGPPPSDSGAQTKEAGAQDDRAKEATTAQTASDKSAHGNKKERPTRAERRAFKAGQGDKSTSKATTDDSKTQPPNKTPGPQILKKPQTPQTPTAPKGPAALRAPASEPVPARNTPNSAQTSSNAADTEPTPATPTNVAPKPTPPAPAPAPTSKQAFLKHANPSQGITEPLIEEALKVFGAVEKVEIDKRKGFAYVDFAEPEGLQKAMAASPIKIAQGAVQVLERKEKIPRNPRFNGPPTGPARGGRGGFAHRGRGGRGGARGGGHAAAGGSTPASPAPTPVTPASVASNDATT